MTNLELSEQELRQMLRATSQVVSEHSIKSERASNPATKAEHAQIAAMYGRLADKVRAAIN